MISVIRKGLRRNFCLMKDEEYCEGVKVVELLIVEVFGRDRRQETMRVLSVTEEAKGHRKFETRTRL